jgi:hypothetical protein
MSRGQGDNFGEGRLYRARVVTHMSILFLLLLLTLRLILVRKLQWNEVLSVSFLFAAATMDKLTEGYIVICIREVKRLQSLMDSLIAWWDFSA